MMAKKKIHPSAADDPPRKTEVKPKLGIDSMAMNYEERYDETKYANLAVGGRKLLRLMTSLDGYGQHNMPENGHKFLIRESSTYLKYFNLLVFMGMMYYVFVLPFYLGFDFEYNYHSIMRAQNVVVDIIFVVDLFVNFFIERYIHGILTTNMKVLAQTYLLGNFMLNFVSAIPCEFLILDQESTTASNSLLLLKLTKFYSSYSIIQDMSSFFKGGSILKSILKYMIITWMIIHWSSMFMAIVTDLNAESTFYIYEGSSNSHKYATYFYETIIQLLGDGDPTTLEENISFSLISLFGFVLQAIILGKVSADIQRSQYKTNLWAIKMDHIEEAMERMKLKDGIRRRVRHHFDFTWAVFDGDNERESWLNELSDDLHIAVLLQSKGELFKKVDVFQDSCKQFLGLVIKNLGNKLYLPGDYVIHHGDMGQEMYFIVLGVLKAYNKEETIEFSVMHEGTCFGEVALVTEAKRTATVISTTYSHLNILTSQDFEDILQYFPSEQTRIKQLAKKRQENSIAVIKQTESLNRKNANKSNGGKKTIIINKKRKSSISSINPKNIMMSALSRRPSVGSLTDTDPNFEYNPDEDVGNNILAMHTRRKTNLHDDQAIHDLRKMVQELRETNIQQAKEFTDQIGDLKSLISQLLPNQNRNQLHTPNVPSDVSDNRPPRSTVSSSSILSHANFSTYTDAPTRLTSEKREPRSSIILPGDTKRVRKVSKVNIDDAESLLSSS